MRLSHYLKVLRPESYIVAIFTRCNDQKLVPELSEFSFLYFHIDVYYEYYRRTLALRRVRPAGCWSAIKGSETTLTNNYLVLKCTRTPSVFRSPE